MLGWAAVAVGILIFVLWPHASATNRGYQIERLRQELAKEQGYQRYYVLDLELELRPQEIRRRAMTELHMVDPADKAILSLEIVPPHPPASRAIVASAAR
jgi:hypothetical protein